MGKGRRNDGTKGGRRKDRGRGEMALVREERGREKDREEEAVRRKERRKGRKRKRKEEEKEDIMKG